MLLLDNDELWQQGEQSAVVLLGGEMPQDERWLSIIREAQLLAAADGGAALALSMGRLPDLLVGDFDSLDAKLVAECEQGGVEMLRLPVMKDMTDGEYLLDELLARGYRRLLVLGALGGRPDMQLANIFGAAELARRGAEILLAHDNALLIPLYAGDGPDDACELVLKGFAGKTFSQIAISERCRHILLDGFFYPLDGELARRQTLGLSNIIDRDEAHLTLHGGTLLAVINL